MASGYSENDFPTTDAALALAVRLGYTVVLGTCWHGDGTVDFDCEIGRPAASNWLTESQPAVADTAAGAILKAIEVAQQVESHPAGRFLAAA
jgi:hypothetical protein